MFRLMCGGIVCDARYRHSIIHPIDGSVELFARHPLSPFLLGSQCNLERILNGCDQLPRYMHVLHKYRNTIAKTAFDTIIELPALQQCVICLYELNSCRFRRIFVLHMWGLFLRFYITINRINRLGLFASAYVQSHRHKHTHTHKFTYEREREKAELHRLPFTSQTCRRHS